MDVRRWMARRDQDWQTLDSLLTQTEKQGIKSLSAQEIQQLAGLYRSTSADLARAQTHNLSPRLKQQLQTLITRAYSQIYQGDRRQEWGKVIDFYRWQLPLIFQQTWLYTLTAFAIFTLGGFIAWGYSWRDPNFLALVVPEDLIITVRDKNELWMGSILTMKPVAASGIMINNLSVAFRMVAGGAIAGLWTIFALFYNGLLIGAVSALVAQHHLALPFWAFVFPHGALELPAIFLAGAAGLLIAKGIILPGDYPRGDAIKSQAKLAAQLVFALVPMLFIAGIIEGFISPAHWIPSSFKYVLGTALFLGFLSYASRQKTLP
ncbi:MAG: stage II sporulation protein M [Synechocystis sp.]|nr:stage II sporulation protein M [Synechocystis sp.]